MRGPNVMKGYLNDPSSTAATIDEQGWIHTGDIVKVDEKGLYYVTDRLKELLKWKGSQVAPAELEALLVTHPAISDAAVVGIPDAEAGDLPKAHVVLKAGQTATEDEIIEWLSARVAPTKRIRGGVEFATEIPKTASGKILRRVLKEKELQRLREKNNA
jgi:acyl-CoA synthetase (AMP-forming)/AMP-acid ligase II